MPTVQVQRLMDQLLDRLNREEGTKLCGVQPCSSSYCEEIRWLGDKAQKKA